MSAKLYTRRGDDGQTDLSANMRKSKADPRLIAIGEVDELNAAIGLALAACDQEELTTILIDLQHHLFELGAELAAPAPAPGTSSGGSSDSGGGGGARRIEDEDITHLERMIDTTSQPLTEMREFILPGGTELAARLHLARTICRRAERGCVTLASNESLADNIVIFLNRTSDLLFAMARRANQLANHEDVPWRKTRTR